MKAALDEQVAKLAKLGKVIQKNIGGFCGMMAMLI